LPVAVAVAVTALLAVVLVVIAPRFSGSHLAVAFRLNRLCFWHRGLTR
jgi:hypothetical protein